MDIIGARQVRVFCDADVLIAGAASTTGASHILLRLSELTLLECVTCGHAIGEAERNLLAKLPAAVPAFRLIIDAAVRVLADASPSQCKALTGQAHVKDFPILAAAIAGKADYLSTFNTRHFRARETAPLVLAPGLVLTRIRRSLARLVEPLDR